MVLFLVFISGAALLGAIGYLVFLLVFLWFSLTIKVPFISIPKEILPAIEKALALNEKSVVYDLGCGDGRVLAFLSRKNPNAAYIGIEKNLFAYFLAKRKIKSRNPKIILGDFFAHDLSQASHIFLYLYPLLLNQLLPKFQKELKPGTIVVSCDYQFQNKPADQIINLNRPAHSLGRTLYLYKF